MKWCFLLNQAQNLSEFFGKFANETASQGDEYIVLAESKIVEYSKTPFFPEEANILSKGDWCKANYKREYQEFGRLSWKEFSPVFERRREHWHPSYEDSVDIVSQLYQWMDAVLRQEKPDVVIHEPPAGLFGKIAYFLCQTHHIPFLGFIGSRIRGRIDIHDLEYGCSKYAKTFQELQITSIPEKEKVFAKDFIRDFTTHKILPSYEEERRKISGWKQLRRSIEYIRETGKPWLRYWKERNSLKQFDHESEILFKQAFVRIWNIPKHRIRWKTQKHIFDNADGKEPFFLFPLQVQHESTLHVLAPYYVDQLNTVKNIAFALPFPYKLYVKEHPAAFGDHPTTFYAELKKIPNVVLLSFQEDTHHLIEKSRGVVTLASTVGMEAAIAGKLTYVLGDAFYAYHPLCRKIRGFEELRQQIQADLSHPPSLEGLEDINIRFILSYARNTVPGELAVSIGKQDANDYSLMYQELKQLFFSKEY